MHWALRKMIKHQLHILRQGRLALNDIPLKQNRVSDHVVMCQTALTLEDEHILF